jgi:hypothetical protein
MQDLLQELGGNGWEIKATHKNSADMNIAQDSLKLPLQPTTKTLGTVSVCRAALIKIVQWENKRK